MAPKGISRYIRSRRNEKGGYVNRKETLGGDIKEDTMRVSLVTVNDLAIDLNGFQ